ncbi:hypothetical protein BDF19DRAFT_439804 [Syncephalis fuscata]|nr:hypothetical protein BDF19DRAFT_439804 [Syncephalis fuscata]
MFTLFKRPTATGSKDSATPMCYHVEGFLECAYFHAAVDTAEQLKKEGAVVRVRSFENREVWLERLQSLQQRVQGASEHKTSPMVFKGCREQDWQLVGGYTELKERTATNILH